VPIWNAVNIVANALFISVLGRGVILPFTVSRNVTPGFALEVTTAVASSLARAGIYADSGGQPGTLLADLGTIDTSTIGVKNWTNTQALTAGTQYWIIVVPQGAAGVQVRSQQQAFGAEVGRKAANASTASSGLCYGYDVAGITGTMPTTVTFTDGGANFVPRLMLVVP
jgi:hypothetical protein